MRQGFRLRKRELLVPTQELHQNLLAVIEKQDIEGARLATIAHFAMPLEELDQEFQS
jgi:DNA-binding FadR family transcriptional regulator